MYDLRTLVWTGQICKKGQYFFLMVSISHMKKLSASHMKPSPTLVKFVAPWSWQYSEYVSMNT